MAKKNKRKVFLIIWSAVFLCVLYQSGFTEVVEELQRIAESTDIQKQEASKQRVTFDRKVDGDTAMFEMNNELIKCRFLAIDTPETVKKGTEVQPFGMEASDYTNTMLANAKEIVLEFDPMSDEKDKYDRYLAWIWVDGVLLQEKLLEKGYAKIEYVYGDYLYLDVLEKAQEKAKAQHLGIWSQ